MKVGDYVRTRDGIAKIEKIRNGVIILDVELDLTAEGFENQYLKEDIIKSSPNIIDLIEVGDILSFKDYAICRVIEITDNGYYLLKDYGGEQYYERKEYMSELTSIVTKEQFSQMEYKVGD